MIAPIKVSETTLYKPLMSICLRLLSSNKLWIAIAQKANSPVWKPMAIPLCTSVWEPDKNSARLAAIINEKINVKPNIFPLLPDLIWSSVKLPSVIQAFPKSGREYQIPPSTKADKAAATTASQLRCVKSIG
jgi:hypothetical protein